MSVVDVLVVLVVLEVPEELLELRGLSGARVLLRCCAGSCRWAISVVVVLAVGRPSVLLVLLLGMPGVPVTRANSCKVPRMWCRVCEGIGGACCRCVTSCLHCWPAVGCCAHW